MDEIKIDAHVFQVIRVNRSKSVGRIFRIIRRSLPDLTPDDIKQSLLRISDTEEDES